MPKITVPQRVTIPDPRAGACLTPGRLLTAGGEITFDAGTWEVSEDLAAIYAGTYRLPEGCTDLRGRPIEPRLAVELPPPINPDDSLSVPDTEG